MRANQADSIECPVESQPPSEISWFKDGAKLGEEPTRLEQSAGELIILQASEEDAGDYYCRASNYLGSLTSPSFRLNVQSSEYPSCALSRSSKIQLLNGKQRPPVRRLIYNSIITCAWPIQ